MIGGGVLPNFEENFKFDKELFIRYAQVAAFMAIMQFAFIENQKRCFKAYKGHEKYLPILIKNIDKAKKGIPLLQSLAHNLNDNKYAYIKDEFFLGKDLLICPQVYKGNKRKVIILKGEWLSDLGDTYLEGEYEIDVSLNRIPRFMRIK